MKKSSLLFTVIIALAILTSGFIVTGSFRAKKSSPASKMASSYTWTGAWQPARKSAGDGVTALDIKIGRFLNFDKKEEYAHTVFNVNNRFPGSKAWSAWAVGDMSGLTPAHKGLTDKQHEDYLTYMDQLGVTVFLEIFPTKKANTNVLAEIDYWLGKFKKHRSVAGFGVDLEYFEKATDASAKAWDEKIKSYNPSYRLFLRHYDPGFMPPAYRGKGDLIFIDYASEGTIEDLNKGFAAWANRFTPTACAFQIGYPADEDGMNGSNTLGWWKLKDPIKEWGDMILSQISNPGQELGLIWVTAKSGKSYNSGWDITKGAKIPERDK